ncbi:hypothetical protein BCR41DRAFT_175810 [Lobosporangium transversale]|uniref:Secreted protein n=1 Tax=Lobosporangium transversale TaxID=64571 RepID=A0A1Y2GES9_9FUNG|nr:hypothetical protein BCR41DRAFT_175810 [Lobosporangium transversale]ORZ05704.1 hypothetical protein BCR41DRAFT_175810 [Lobosporangium transversale]|eukprot:XP_021877191.1 hypothetical protein BCR41DRAFT_175810 [Lobosporangium transversale]
MNLAGVLLMLSDSGGCVCREHPALSLYLYILEHNGCEDCNHYQRYARTSLDCASLICSDGRRGTCCSRCDGRETCCCCS